jgi:tetraacyldisaccharide 4'-kinase
VTPLTDLARPAATGTHARYLALVRGETRGPWAAAQRLGLWTLSLPYGLAVRLRNAAFDRGWLRVRKAPVPVVSVGNLTVGGTGKTPCVEYVARFYRNHGLRVAILSRGYGTTVGQNDEAMVLEENLPDVPHLQGPDRAALAQIAVEELESEVLVLDDGFQHRRLARDLDLVLIDAMAPWGCGHLLPRGLLREPLSGLRRAGVAMLTRCDQVDVGERERLRQCLARMAPAVPLVEGSHCPIELINGDRAVEPIDRLRGRSVAAFCGIGNPEAFRRTLTDLGANVTAFRAYSDHHAYASQDVDDLRRWADSLIDVDDVITTQKDLVKLRIAALASRPLWALRIDLKVERGEELLARHLSAVLSGSEVVGW